MLNHASKPRSPERRAAVITALQTVADLEYEDFDNVSAKELHPLIRDIGHTLVDLDALWRTRVHQSNSNGKKAAKP